MRFRTKRDVRHCHYAYDVYGQPGHTGPSHTEQFTGDVLVGWESIIDTPPTKRRRNASLEPEFHPVYHETIQCTDLPADSLCDVGSQTLENFNGQSFDYTVDPQDCLVHVPCPSLGPSTPDLSMFSFLNLQGFANSAHASWEPVAEEFSLANDILEWRDVQKLISGLRNKALRAAGKLEAEKKRWRYNSDGTVNAFLAYNFGVAPLIADIQDLAAAYYRIKTRLRFLLKTKGKKVTLHASNTFATADDAFPFGWPSLSGFSQCVVGRQRTYHFVIGARLYQDLQGLEDASAYVKALTAYTGFNKPLKIAWNAIPYSFLIDWSFNIGHHFDGFAIPVFAGAYDVVDPWWSCRSKGTVQKWILWPTGFTTSTPKIRASWNVDRYIRVLGPFVPPSPPWTLLQKLLFGALVDQRTRPSIGKGPGIYRTIEQILHGFHR